MEDYREPDNIRRWHLVLTRQNLPTLDRTKYAPASGVAKGAYVLADAPGGKPDVILLGTGSELSLCVEAYEKLKTEGIKARVVSMPSWEIFEQQDAAYKESVLPSNVTARVSVEMAATFGWGRYTGLQGPQYRDAPFWRIGTLQRFVEVFRVHSRQSGGGSARRFRKISSHEFRKIWRKLSSFVPFIAGSSSNSLGRSLHATHWSR